MDSCLALLLVWCVLVSHTEAGMLADPGIRTSEAECEGWITLQGPRGQVVVTQDREVLSKMEVLTVHVSGCWCWRLHRGRRGVGASHTVTRGRHNLERMGVRSVYRVDCAGDT